MPAALDDPPRLRPPEALSWDPHLPERVAQFRRFVLRQWRALVPAMALFLVVASVTVVVELKRYRPLSFSEVADCCGLTDGPGEPPGSRMAEVGPGSKDFFVTVQLTDGGRWPVRIDAIGGPQLAGLSGMVSGPLIGLVDDQHIGLGEPLAPVHAFDLGGKQTRFIVLRGDISHCPPWHIGAGMHTSLTIAALTVHWSAYGIAHTTRVPLVPSYVLTTSTQCSGH